MTDWDGEHCQICGKGYDTVYWLPDDWWAAITPKPENPEAGLLCPDCALVRLLKAHSNDQFEDIIAKDLSTAPDVSRPCQPTLDLLEPESRGFLEGLAWLVDRRRDRKGRR